MLGGVQTSHYTASEFKIMFGNKHHDGLLQALDQASPSHSWVRIQSQPFARLQAGTEQEEQLPVVEAYIYR